MTPETALTETKLYPPRRRSDLLVRSRLVEFIHEHIENKLLLLCAPAGYGKTTLLVDYIHDLDVPVCWLSLDESDRDPVVFLDNLLASLRGHFPDFAPDVPVGPWTSWGETRLARLATAFVNEVRRSAADYFLIILDDYHLVNDSQVVNAFVDRVLVATGLEEAAGKQLRKYSKGMLQRIGIAQALINDPRLVLLDEPMTGLDPLGRVEVKRIILRLREEGRTILFSSHILADVGELCTRAAIMDRGTVVWHGPVVEAVERGGGSLEDFFVATVTGGQAGVAS